MCNNYVFRPPTEGLFAGLRDGGALTYPQGAPNIGEADIRIGDRAPIVTRSGSTSALIMAPWSWKAPQGRPVFNFRSEGRSFADTQRCLIPAAGFYEFTEALPGEKRKTKWLFTTSAHEDFWIAGIVRQGAFAMLTTQAGLDVAPYHDRQIVVLEPDRGMAWLELAVPESVLFEPAPRGFLTVRRVYPEAS